MTGYALDSGVYATPNRAVWYAPMLRFFIVDLYVIKPSVLRICIVTRVADHSGAHI